MLKIDSIIINTLIKQTLDRSNIKEIDVTQAVIDVLKKTRKGIFQNEIDYRFLLDDFKPLKTSSRSAIDILGFMGDKFHFVEFKLFDEEKPRSYHHWSALWHLRSDIEKLKHASSFNSKYDIEFYYVFAVRNFMDTINESQLDLASEFILKDDDVKPKIKGFNQLTVLKTIEQVSKNNPEGWGKWETDIKKSKGDVFLIGKLCK